MITTEGNVVWGIEDLLLYVILTVLYQIYVCRCFCMHLCVSSMCFRRISWPFSLPLARQQRTALHIIYI